jgi:hypothetical protein
MDKEIVNQTLKTIAEEDIINKYSNVDTLELIQILSIRVNSNLYVQCIECSNENDEFPYFGLELNFKMVCELPLCKRHRKQYIYQNKT